MSIFAFNICAYKVLVALHERLPSTSCLGLDVDIELLVFGAQKLPRTCYTTAAVLLVLQQCTADSLRAKRFCPRYKRSSLYRERTRNARTKPLLALPRLETCQAYSIASLHIYRSVALCRIDTSVWRWNDVPIEKHALWHRQNSVLHILLLHR